jgi:hypothetical protein
MTSVTTNIPVWPLLRVIASGVEATTGKRNDAGDATTRRLKATIVLSPRIAPSGKGFELAHWPSGASNWLREQFLSPNADAEIRLSEIDTGESVSETKSIRAANLRFVDLHQQYWPSIDALWAACFREVSSDSAWSQLALDLDALLKCAPTTPSSVADSTQANDTAAAPANGKTPKEDDFDVDGAVIVRDKSADQVPPISSVIAIKHADICVDEERRRALRVARKMTTGPGACDPDPQKPNDPPGTPNAKTKEQFDQMVRELRWAEYSQAVEATKEDRSDGEETLKLIRQALKSGATADQCKAIDFRQSDHRCVPTKDKADPAACKADRASHTFGTWLQRRQSFQHIRNGDDLSRLDYDEVNEQASSLAPSDASKRLLALFHGLQDDPVLSRIFFLVVDVTFDLSIDKSKLQEPLYLHLWFGVRGKKGARVGAPTGGAGSIATAARLYGDAFWPVSAFEAGVPDVKPTETGCMEALVEQRDGIWKLGMSGAALDAVPDRAPRYELTSLDIRRAIDSKPDAVDGGQRQITGGLILLDRGRSYQILREIGLAGRGEKCGGDSFLILYAEDLTVGRRLDVAAIGPGAPVGDIQWRSLMQRLVQYKFLIPSAVQNVRNVIALLFPSKSRGADSLFSVEGSFQVVARHAPRMSVNGQADATIQWDVVADEALYTWDGTPAGVLTDPGRPTNRTAASLPYSRTYSLPTTRTAPPLRYGVPYVFSARSVFNGGGSPNTTQSENFHIRTGGTAMLPSARTPMGSGPPVVAPRRFLRHEGILAPTLLLPKHLSTYRYNVMGFENLDTAIVRSGLPPADPHRREDDASPDRAPYDNLDKRLNPEKTMRVFVAPTASFEDVVRHGRLDIDDFARVLRGGLRTVAYEYVPEDLENGVTKVSGFPYVVTDRYAALDGQGAAYHRRIARPDEKISGIPFFHPGGPRHVPKDAVGWLPDPAAHAFSVRARVRGSAKYLDGDLQADLYDVGIRYPDALPLVLDIRRISGRRYAHGSAASIHELISGKPTASLVRIDENGIPSSSKTGTPVRYFRIELFEGEDYDLEVTCLPTASMLAKAFALPETMAIQRMAACMHVGISEDLKTFVGDVDLAACCWYGYQAMTGIGGHLVPDNQVVLKCASDLLETMRQKWPIEEVASVRTLRVCHAVNRPSIRPVLQDLVVRRVKEIPKIGAVADAKNESNATTLLLDGKLSIDLDQIDAFEVIVETTSTGGALIDDPKRSRSQTSLRSGRWPQFTTPTGGREYVGTEKVYGFKVKEDLRVELPTEQVTLLRVENLPVERAVGDILEPEAKLQACTRTQPDGVLLAGNTVFDLAEGRLPIIAMGAMHASALDSRAVEMTIARPPDTEETDPGVRKIKVSLPASIADTRARYLKVRVRALCRFAETFETAPVYIDGKEPLLYRRQGLRTYDQSIESVVATKWSCATERPAPCEPLRPEPTFTLERSAHSDGCGGMVHRVERRVMTRLYFRRGWFSSGDGERLGLVLWPPNYFDRDMHSLEKDKVSVDGRSMSVASFEDKDLGVGGSYITRWGGDPIRKDEFPQQAVLIPAEAFVDAIDGLSDKFHCARSVHDPKVVNKAWMPTPKPMDNLSVTNDGGGHAVPDVQDTFLQVCLITYEPCFDCDREEWFVDVDLRTYRPSEPFVRFGLVRYQENAIDPKLCVSPPTSVTIPLLPSRSLEIRLPAPAPTGECQLEVCMSGPGFSDIKDLKIADTFADQPSPEVDKWLTAFSKLRRPWMRVWLSHEVVGEAGLVIRTPIDSPHPNSKTGEWEVQPELEDDRLTWRQTIPLAGSLNKPSWTGTLVAYVEEIDRRMPSSYSKEPIDPTSLFDEVTFVDSGPRFSARVPFMEIGGLRGGAHAGGRLTDRPSMSGPAPPVSTKRRR